MGKIENLSRTVTEIINKGIELTSSQPMYFYTKLADVKQQMIADATKDARERAKKIAENAGSSLGSLKKPAWELYRLQHPIPEKTIHGAVHSTPLPKRKKPALLSN